MWGSIIGGLVVKDASIVAYDTRSHSRQIMIQEWNRVRHRAVELINQKAHLAQYCALAACGRRSFSLSLHRKLLAQVTRGLTANYKRQLKPTEAAEFLRDTIEEMVENVSGNETRKSELQSQVHKCGLILAIWESLENGTMAPKLKRLHRGEILEDAPFCAQGVRHKYATAVLREGYRPNMSIVEGVALLVKAFRAAFNADNKLILGGYIEVLVVGYKDIYSFPMSRGQQMLNRAFTYLRVKKFPKRGRRKPVKAPAPYIRRKLILAASSDDEL